MLSENPETRLAAARRHNLTALPTDFRILDIRGEFYSRKNGRGAELRYLKFESIDGRKLQRIVFFFVLMDLTVESRAMRRRYSPPLMQQPIGLFYLFNAI